VFEISLFPLVGNVKFRYRKYIYTYCDLRMNKVWLDEYSTMCTKLVPMNKRHKREKKLITVKLLK
jgi:hypothetical protein